MTCMVEFIKDGCLEADDRAGLIYAIINFYGDTSHGFSYPDIDQVWIKWGEDEWAHISVGALEEFKRDLDSAMESCVADYVNAPSADEQRSHPL